MASLLATTFATSLSFNRAPEPACLAVETSLLHRVDGIPDQTFESLDLGLSLRDGGILTRPLSNERPGRPEFIEERLSDPERMCT